MRMCDGAMTEQSEENICPQGHFCRFFLINRDSSFSCNENPMHPASIAKKMLVFLF